MLALSGSWSAQHWEPSESRPGVSQVPPDSSVNAGAIRWISRLKLSSWERRNIWKTFVLGACICVYVCVHAYVGCVGCVHAVCTECVGVSTPVWSCRNQSMMALYYSSLIALRHGLSLNLKLAIWARLSDHQALGISLSFCPLKSVLQACVAVLAFILELVVQTQVCIFAFLHSMHLCPESAPQPWKGFISDTGSSSRSSIMSLFWQACKMHPLSLSKVSFSHPIILKYLYIM